MIMKIPVSWLKEYVDIKIPVEKLAESLTLSGSEVDQIHKGDEFKDIVVGEILEIEKHPNADKLRVTKVSVGKEILQIVCGASNIEVGQKVPVALIGAQVGEFEIKKAELRGVKSYGMLCSEAELEISDDHSGIMILDPKAKVGECLASVLNMDDIVLDIDLTPNRSDCFSLVGMARETAATLDAKLRVVEPKAVKVASKEKMTIDVKDKECCPRYIAKVIEGIEIKPSPEWMQKHLAAAGVRPINNVVDITNYVCLEWGQPLHAFDMDKIDGDKIIVRRAKAGERIETLDDTLRTLDENDLVIADSAGAIAVAGVMGGASSEVSNSTKNIVLESANFDRVMIRKTAQKLKLRSESSSRFEKGLPLKLQEMAVERAAELVLELAGGSAGANVDVQNQKSAKVSVKMNFSKFEKFLGYKVPESRITLILTSLGLVCKKSGDTLVTEVPWWRPDIKIAEDLFEEIARIYGYNNLPSTLPSGELPSIKKNEKVSLISDIKDILSGIGFSEIINYSFTSKKVISALGDDAKNYLKISNPISPDMEYLRTSLVGSLLGNVQTNQDSFSKVSVFEVANIYKPDQKGSFKEDTLLAFAVSSEKKNGESFFEAKGVLDLILEKLSIVDYKLTAENISVLEKGRSVALMLGSQKIGVMGEVTEKIRRQFGIRDDVTVVEVNVKYLLESYGNVKKYQLFSRFPVSARDLTFVIEEGVTVGEIYETIDEIKSGIRKKVEVIDVYRGKGFPEGEKSISIRFTYQAKDRTLTDEEVDEDQAEIIKKVKGTLGGILRGEGK